MKLKLLPTFLFIFFVREACAQSLSIIRDSETENFLANLTRPIFDAAGLDSDNIKIYIVNDDGLNAFVAGGQNVFINSGLITKYDHPDVLIGVIAHEAGHIAGGHLARSSEAMEGAQSTLLLSYLLGIAAGVSAGRADVGYAMIAGGSQIAQRLALKYNRGQEEAADQLALQYLDKMNYSARGLLQLLEFFSRSESRGDDEISEYMLTHPISSKRVDFIKAHLQKRYYNNSKIDHLLALEMPRIVAKLEAFLYSPDLILNKYHGSRPTSLYAQSIAYFKKGEIAKALSRIDDLVKLDDNDGYLWELRGQILFESGRIKEGILAYKRALELQKTNNSLIRIALGNAIISLQSDDKELNNFAIENLLIAAKTEKDDPNLFRQLSKAYNQNGDVGHSYLALAEMNLLIGDFKKTKKYAELAKEKLDKNDKAAMIKADDLLEIKN